MGAALGVVVAAVFAGGFFFRDVVDGLSAPVQAQAQAQPGADARGGYPLLDEVQTLLDEHYLRDQPTAQEREYAAIRGMLSALADRYTFFIDPPVAQSESDVLAGTYGGIGVLIQRNEAGEIALYPFADGPATAAGVEDGDILVAVNGQALEPTIPQDQVDQMLRGEVKEGSGVELTLRRAGRDEPLVLFVPFAVINIPSVVWRVLAEDERLGYIQILRFTSRTPDELRAGLTELAGAGIAGLVVDLRNNSGGLLQESITVTDEFVDAGVLAFERDQGGERGFEGAAGGLATSLPLAVLVNQGTASGAELVAGALQDYERGPLIGQVTYGKGSIQQIYPLSDGSSLHVTSAEWYTPDRQALNDEGLQPDIAMIPDVNGRDVELGEAIRHLQAAVTGEAA